MIPNLAEVVLSIMERIEHDSVLGQSAYQIGIGFDEGGALCIWAKGDSRVQAQFAYRLECVLVEDGFPWYVNASGSKMPGQDWSSALVVLFSIETEKVFVR